MGRTFRADRRRGQGTGEHAGIGGRRPAHLRWRLRLFRRGLRSESPVWTDATHRSQISRALAAAASLIFTRRLSTCVAAIATIVFQIGCSEKEKRAKKR